MATLNEKYAGPNFRIILGIKVQGNFECKVLFEHPHVIKPLCAVNLESCTE